MTRLNPASVTLTLGALLASGCAAGFGWVGPLEAQIPKDAGALDAAVEAYYTASSADGLRGAVAAALMAGPGTASAHEIAADLARLDEDLDRQVEHLLVALADTSNDAPALHLMWLGWIELTTPERRKAIARATQLARAHADPAVRAAAAFTATHLLSRDADYRGMASLRAEHFPGLEMALIGTWDNDQGKGFDTVRPPEEGIDLTARYSGTVVEVGWRTGLPRTREGVYDLDSLMSPSFWSTVYATAVLEAEEAGPYELRMGTTSPFKLWLNGQLIASVEERRAVQTFDGFLTPLSLRKGPNRLLIKLAHRKGSWTLHPRVTGPGGAPAPGLKLADPGAAVGPAEGPAPDLRSAADYAAARVDGLRGSPARKRTLAAAWAEHLGLSPEAIRLAQTAVAAHPEAIIPAYLLAGIHWNHQERGQAADLLGRLDRQVGAELPFVRGQQARFWLQQDRDDQARSHLVALRDAHPDSAQVWRRLADYFDEESWNQERCDALEKANALRPRWPAGLDDLAACYKSLGRGRAAMDALHLGLAEVPGSYGILKRTSEAHARRGRLGRAVAFARRLVVGWPANYDVRVRLANLHRKAGDLDAARETYLEATTLDPDASWAHKRLGALAREQGALGAAVAHWRDALERNPDDDKLARYVSFHEAGPDEPWLADVPDEETITRAIAVGRAATPPVGADAVALIDHSVTRLLADGSRSGVVTHVILAVNEQGRDRVTSMRLAERGRIQVLEAYASSPDGTRVEATRPRDGKVRFRALEDGSVVVLQYRHDGGPQPYLALHMADMWSFHSVGWASTWSEWALWLDQDEAVHEQGLGEYARTEEPRGPLKRITWTMRDVPPLILEPGAPSRQEVVNHVMVSTVPDWETFMRWEAALLAGAFRPGPELEAVAHELVGPEDSPQARVLKLHRYVMNEIRYEQDYENTIAGVKPHAAPVVLERRYGDCKDKAVLFITLARLVGVEAHFAILKTRPKGPVYREVPYQQFDHAIVYVPAQTGIEAGRFYDPTADSLDLDVLRQDDAGALALVFDPVAGTHTWIRIPFQAPTAHRTGFEMDLTVRPDGSAEGVLTLTGRGSMGAQFRRRARNRAKFDKWISGIVGVLIPGAIVGAITPVEVEDLTRDAVITVAFSAPDVAQGREARLTLPWGRLYRVTPSFKLPERRYDLLRGVPQIVDLVIRYHLPKRARLITIPAPHVVDNDCFRFSRTVDATRSEVTIKSRLTRRCERITPQDYKAHRRVAKRVDELNAEALVVRLR